MNKINNNYEQCSNINTEEISYAIERIEHMEKTFDEAQNSFNSDNTCINDPAFQRKVSFLKQYLESGQWLRDYYMDEKGVFPKELKRGILSEDGLYNFICDVEQANKKKNCPVKDFFSKIFKK